VPNTVTLVISEEQHAKIKRLAELVGKSASAIVRDLIDSLPDEPVPVPSDSGSELPD